MYTCDIFWLEVIWKPIFSFSVAAAAAEMAYHTTRPPIAVTFPKPIVALLQSCWNASADVSLFVF